MSKTRLAIVLEHTDCRQGHTLLFTRSVDIPIALYADPATSGLKRELARLLKRALAWVDVRVELPIDKFGADCHFQAIRQRYARGSAGIPPIRAVKS